MYFELNLKIRKREKFFDLVSNHSRTRIKKMLFMDYLFYLNIFLKSFGFEINKIELKESNNDYEQIGLTNEAKLHEYHNFHKIFQIKKSFSGEKTEEEELFIIQSARDLSNLSEKAYKLLKTNIHSISQQKLKSLNKINSFKKKNQSIFSN